MLPGQKQVIWSLDLLLQMYVFTSTVVFKDCMNIV